MSCELPVGSPPLTRSPATHPISTVSTSGTPITNTPQLARIGTPQSRLGTPQANGIRRSPNTKSQMMFSNSVNGASSTLSSSTSVNPNAKYIISRSGGPSFIVDTTKSGAIRRSHVGTKRTVSLCTVIWAVRVVVRLVAMMRISSARGALTARGVHRIDVDEERTSKDAENNRTKELGGRRRYGSPSPAMIALGASVRGASSPLRSPLDQPLSPAVLMFAEQTTRDVASAALAISQEPIGIASLGVSGKEAASRMAATPSEDLGGEEAEKAKAAMFAAQVQQAVEHADDPALELSYCDPDENDKISEDGDLKRKGGKANGDIDASYYPDPHEIMMLPVVLQQHLLRRARLVLSRFVFMFRLRKAIHKRHRLAGPLSVGGSGMSSSTPTQFSLPQSLLSDSMVFCDWPKAAITELCVHCPTEHFTARTLIQYYNQPRPHIYFLLEGSVMIVERRDSSKKGVNSRRNGVVVKTLKGPCVVNEALLYVDDRLKYAIEAASKATLISIPPSTADEVTQKLIPQEQQQAFFKRCVEMRRERVMQRTTADVVGWSPLFKGLTLSQKEEVFRSLEVRSYMQGSSILNRREGDNFVMFWVLRGSVEGVGTTRRKDQSWGTKVFASFDKGSTIGEKSVYFKEPYLYSLVAKVHCDVLQLRAGALSLLGVMDRELSRAIANGAFAVRGADASVRLLLQCPRNIPPILSLIKDEIINDTFVRELQKRFSFRIVPRGEFIATKGNIIHEVIVLVSGAAHVTVSSRDNLVLPLNVAVGGHALAGAMWRHSVIAQTSCQLWALSLADYVSLARENGVFGHLRERSASLLSVPAKGNDALEAITHRRIPELAAAKRGSTGVDSDGGDGSPSSTANTKRESHATRKTTKTFEIISSPIRPPIPAMDPAALKKLTKRASDFVKRDTNRRVERRVGTPSKGITTRATERSRSLIAYLMSTSPAKSTTMPLRSATSNLSGVRSIMGRPPRPDSPQQNLFTEVEIPQSFSAETPSRLRSGEAELPPLRASPNNNMPRPATTNAVSWGGLSYDTRPSTRLNPSPSRGETSSGPVVSIQRRSLSSVTASRAASPSQSGTRLWASKSSPLEAIGSLRDRHASRQMTEALSSPIGRLKAIEGTK